VLTRQPPILEPDDDDEGELIDNHPLFLHAMIMLAMAPYNVRLSTGSSNKPVSDEKALRRSAVAVSKALGISEEDVEVSRQYTQSSQKRV